MDLCVYRIVQEALTNTLKYAGPATASVDLDYTELAVVVVITDNGRGPGHATGGHGIVGMAERAALLGGRLHAGPGRAGGFCVTVTIPYDSDVELVAR